MARKRSHARKSNPHRKHRRRHARRHRNPGGMLKGLPGQALKIGVPAIVAGAAAGFVESKFLGAKSPMVRGLARVAMGLGAAALLRKNPMRAAVAAGAIIGGIGNEAGIRMGGGLVLTSKTAGMKELAEAMSADDEMGLVFKEEMRGLGTVVEMQALSDDGGEVGDADVDGISEDEAA